MRTFQAHVYLEENDSKMLVCCDFMVECSTRQQLNHNITKLINDFGNLKDYHFKSYYAEEYIHGKLQVL